MTTLLLSKPIILFAIISIIVALIAIGLRIFFANQWKQKVKDYQSEIAKSHSRILKLEVQNEKLQQRVQDLEGNHQANKIRIA